jgi:hypothetical protein
MKARVLLDTESVCLAGIDGLDAFPKKVRKVLEDWQTDCIVSAFQSWKSPSRTS